jgi:AcrR family transcriptional regulator
LTGRGETRRRLYRAAAELIAEQGFAATTVDAIAERAGVAKGTVFYNFGSKDGLFASLLEHGIDRLTETMTAAAGHAGVFPPGAGPGAGDDAARANGPVQGDGPAQGGASATPSPFAALDAVVLAQLRFFDEYGPFARVLVTELWRTAWQDAVRRLREGALGVYRDLLDEAVARGELRPGFDTGTAATALFGMVLTVSVEGKALHPDRPLERLHGTLKDLIRGRIAAGPRDDEGTRGAGGSSKP